MKTRNQLRQEQSLHFYQRTEDCAKKRKESDLYAIFNTPGTSSPLLTSLLDEPTLCSPSATRAPPKRLPRKIKELHEAPAQQRYEGPRTKKIKTPDYHHSTSFDDTPAPKKPHTSPPGSIKQDYRANNTHRFTRFSGSISESIFNTSRLHRASEAILIQDEKKEVQPISPRKPHTLCLSVWEDQELPEIKNKQKQHKATMFKKYQVLDS